MPSKIPVFARPSKRLTFPAPFQVNLGPIIAAREVWLEEDDLMIA
jgi:hypothetical protein